MLTSYIERRWDFALAPRQQSSRYWLALVLMCSVSERLVQSHGCCAGADDDPRARKLSPQVYATTFMEGRGNDVHRI